MTKVRKIHFCLPFQNDVFFNNGNSIFYLRKLVQTSSKYNNHNNNETLGTALNKSYVG